MARPSPLVTEPQVKARILEAIRYGVPAKFAAEAAGITERTFMNWQARGREATGRKADEPYRQFFQEVREARAQAVSSYQLTQAKVALGQSVKREVRRITMNEDGVHEEVVEREFHPPHPGALQWWLERRVPDYYGAVVARDEESADPDEVMPPDAADRDPAETSQRLTSLLDRLAPTPGAGPPAEGGVPRAGGD